MSSLFKFLRFEISGLVAICYYFLWMVFLFDMKTLPPYVSGNLDLFDITSAAFLFAMPIGFFIQEIHISLASPFRENRKCGGKRAVIKQIRKYYNARLDNKFTPIIVHALSKTDEYVRKEISNRYSYYYARVESAIYAPFLGLILSFVSIFAVCNITNTDFSQCIQFNTFTFIPIISWLMVIILVVDRYYRELLNEIDDLEISVINEYICTNCSNISRRYCPVPPSRDCAKGRPEPDCSETGRHRSGIQAFRH